MRKSLILLFLLISASFAFAQTAVSPFKTPRVTFLDPNGVPLANGCVFTYAGGTSTQQATYTDATGATANSDPVILDSTGSAVIWLGAGTYKFVGWSNGGTNCSSGVQQWSVDQVPGNSFLNASISGGAWTGGTISGAAITDSTISGAAITNSTIDSTPIGQTTPAAGNFTSLASALNTMTSSTTPTFAAGSYGFFTMTLNTNVTSSTITGGQDGQQITMRLCQNSTGQTVNGTTTGFTFAWPSNLLNAPAMNAALSGCTLLQAVYDGGYWYTTYSNSAALVGSYETLAFSYEPRFDASTYTNFSLTITDDISGSQMNGGQTGQLITMAICQNSTGGWEWTWPTNFLYGPSVTKTANSCTGVVAVYDGQNWITVGESTSSSIPLTGNFKQIDSTATPVFKAAEYSEFAMTVNQNVTSSTITGGTPGQLIVLSLTQGSSNTPGPSGSMTGTTSTTGGQLPKYTSFYAKCTYIYTTGESLPSGELEVSTADDDSNHGQHSITWTCPGATGIQSYRFYIGTASGQEDYFFTTSTSSFTQTRTPTTSSPTYGTVGTPPGSITYSVQWPSNLANAPTMSSGIGSTTSLIAMYNGSTWITVGTSTSSGTTDCASFSSSAAAGCTTMADGKVLEWITGSGQGQFGTSGTPGNNPPYASQTITWPIAFQTGCMAPWVVTTTSIADRTVNYWHQVLSWNSTQATVQLQTSQNDAGVGGYWYGGTVTPIVYCIGN